MNTYQALATAQKAIDYKIISQYGRQTILDGISNIEEYLKAKHKILWILKEPNYGYEGDVDIEYLSNEDIEKIYSAESTRRDTYYANVTTYRGWRATYTTISYILAGILGDTERWDDMKDIEADATVDGYYYLNKKAFINIKKIPGGANSNMNEIKEYYTQFKELLLEQIEMINPTIIFNANAVPEMFCDLLKGTRRICGYGFDCAINAQNRLIINTDHPAYPKGNEQQEKYVDRNLKIVQHFLKGTL